MSLCATLRRTRTSRRRRPRRRRPRLAVIQRPQVVAPFRLTSALNIPASVRNDLTQQNLISYCTLRTRVPGAVRFYDRGQDEKMSHLREGFYAVALYKLRIHHLDFSVEADILLRLRRIELLDDTADCHILVDK